MGPGHDAWSDVPHAWLVRRCATLSGDADAAEDLAQDTLLEAWRHGERLTDPTGRDRWLAAIARNVCLRHRRRLGRDARVERLDPEASLPSSDDLEQELERVELLALLERALALLSPSTREVLLARFVEERPHAEIAERLGITEDAALMRVTRAKAALRRVLAGPLRASAAEHVRHDEWSATRLWCTGCGRARLTMRRDDAAITFRCTACHPDAPVSQVPLRNPFFADIGALTRPSAILARLEQRVQAYFAAGAARVVPCTRCGGNARIDAIARDDLGTKPLLHGALARCDACGEQAWSSVSGLGLSTPSVRSFRRAHPRVTTIPARDIDRGGRPAMVVRYDDVAGTASAEVVFDRATLRVIDTSAAN